MKSPPITQRIRPRTYRIALYSLILAVALQLLIFLIAPWLKKRFLALSQPLSKPSHTEAIVHSPETTKKNFSSPSPQAIDKEGGIRSEVNTIPQQPPKIISIDPIIKESTSTGIRWLIPIRTHIPWNQFKPSRLRIQFFLYEKTTTGKILPAKGRTQITFVQPSPSWSTGVEILDARYTPPQSAPSQSLYGYQLRVYYEEKLETQICDPDDICNL